jgi:hypothetical protein
MTRLLHSLTGRGVGTGRENSYKNDPFLLGGGAALVQR